MPIPRFDAPQVGNAPVEAARLNPGMAPNPGVIGQGLQNAAQGFGQIQHEADVLRVTEAFTPLETDAADIVLRATQIKGKQITDPEAYGGDQGASLTETALANLDKAKTSRMEGLSPSQQQKFENAYQRKRADVQRMVSSHETQQLGAMFNQVYTDRDTVLADTISKLGVRNGLPDGELINANLADRVDNARRWASSQGLDPDLAAKAATADTYRSVISGLLVGNNAQAAQAYFSDHKMDLDEKTRLHLEQVISQHVMANDVQTLAQEAAASGKPLDQQLAWVDEKTKGNASLQKALSSEVEHRFTVQERAKVAARQDIEGQLWDMRFPTKPGQQAVNMQDIRKSPQWNDKRLTGEDRNALEAKWDSHSKRNENDPATRVAQFATYMRILDDPKTLMGLTDGQIASFTGTLGADYSMKLMEMKRKAAGNLEALKANSLNDIPFKDIAAEYGIRTKGSMSQEDSARLGLLRDKVLDAVRTEQDAVGKPLGPERKEEILRQHLVDVKVNQPGWWLGMGDGTTEKPLFEVKDFMELKATDEEKTLAVSYLVQAESPINPANVQTMIDAIRARRAK